MGSLAYKIPTLLLKNKEYGSYALALELLWMCQDRTGTPSSQCPRTPMCGLAHWHACSPANRRHSVVLGRILKGLPGCWHSRPVVWVNTETLRKRGRTDTMVFRSRNAV